jgi:dTDP-4-dehydrorhamnose reductase
MQESSPPGPLAVWGGFECSVTRIGDTWRDQLLETGHHSRPCDLDRAATLGLATFRYPFVWERILRDAEAGSDWPWHDARIQRLRGLGTDIVAGLLHHGSGPAGTHLLDPDFPELFADFAARVARRYPDIQRWTPINEPLTTARFSCLYGVWYPHVCDTDAFLRATVAQCRATLLAMRAIRANVADARLVQTEDLGCTFSTAALSAQARYENERRWLSLDLLCGYVDRNHPWRAMLEAAGVNPAHLDELATGEAAPDLIGANYYVTSERFLDHRTGLYPPHLRGGNGYISYADTEAVRVRLPPGSTGWLPRLRDLWQRFGRPIAITEAHLGCDDDAEQVRWFMQAWRAAEALRAEGADLQAVTAWALAGSVDWDSLMTQRRGNWEPGVWDCSIDPPMPRLTADMLLSLTRTGDFTHPALLTQGWWNSDDRFHATPRRA